MSPAPQRVTFIVPPAPVGATAPKPPREGTPFVIVPTALADERETLEPHWLLAIDAATD